MSGNSQFIRKWGLYVASGSTGAGVAISQGSDDPGSESLQLRFEIHQADAQQLANHGTIRVWNPPADVVGKMKQFTWCVLEAGYKYGKYGVIFQGFITYYKYGHESAVDSYLDLTVTDADLGIHFTTINKTLMPGANSAVQQTQAIIAEMQKNGVTPPDSIPQGGPVHPRATVLYGETSNEMENIRKTNSWLWSVQNGKFQVNVNDIAAAGVGVTLDALSGLVGWPTVVPDGIEARCLLNPSIFIKQQVKIDNAAINTSRGTGLDTNVSELMVTTAPNAAPTFFAPTSTDGTYIVFVVEHHGDTRGNDWYTDLVLWAVDSKSGQTLTQDGLVPTDVKIAQDVASGVIANSPPYGT